MANKIIHNNSPFDVQTLKLLVKSITGGKGGLCYGLDIENGIDQITISPGGFIWNGEGFEIKNNVTITGINSNSMEGDVLFFYHSGDSSKITVPQLSWGRLASYSDNIILAFRKNNIWHRVGNIVSNLNLITRDFFVSHLNPKTNVLILDVREGAEWNDAFYFDGYLNWNGLKG